MALRIIQASLRRKTNQILYSRCQQSARYESIFTKYREPPNGFLFNEKPLKPGERRQWESWEPIWNVGWGMAILFAVVGFYYRPDDNVLHWARREAEIRIAEIEEEEAAAAAAAAGDE